MASRARIALACAVAALATVLAAAPVAGGTSPGARPLEGIVVGIDPGHNGRNAADPAFLSQIIWNGREWENCDTAGTATDAGYSETLFNWALAVQLRARLERLGATVVLTRASNHGVGPCVDRRAVLLDRAHADVSLDLHADGGPPDGRGFAILVPVTTPWNRNVVDTSLRLARYVRSAFYNVAHMPWSTYDGVRAIQPRPDLAGLNLTTMPKVLIECGNMRNQADAALLTSPTFQRRAALALSISVLQFLRATHRVAG